MRRYVHMEWSAMTEFGPVDEDTGEHTTTPFFITTKIYTRMLHQDHVVIWHERKDTDKDEGRIEKGIHFGTYGPSLEVPDITIWKNTRLLAVIFIGRPQDVHKSGCTICERLRQPIGVDSDTEVLIDGTGRTVGRVR